MHGLLGMDPGDKRPTVRVEEQSNPTVMAKPGGEETVKE
jgi:hypothetical protein